MGRTIGAAIGAVLVMLFFATVKTQGRNSTPSPTVAASAQIRPAAKPVIDPPATHALRKAH
jgi:hypothetical protein